MSSQGGWVSCVRGEVTAVVGEEIEVEAGLYRETNTKARRRQRARMVSLQLRALEETDWKTMVRNRRSGVCTTLYFDTSKIGRKRRQKDRVKNVDRMREKMKSRLALLLNA